MSSQPKPYLTPDQYLALERTAAYKSQQFPLPLQTQCSLGQLLWPFVNLNAIIPPDLKDVMFS